MRALGGRLFDLDFLMTDEELRAEVRQAARMNGVRRRDLWTAYKAANVSEQAA